MVLHANPLFDRLILKQQYVILVRFGNAIFKTNKNRPIVCLTAVFLMPNSVPYFFNKLYFQFIILNKHNN